MGHRTNNLRNTAQITNLYLYIYANMCLATTILLDLFFPTEFYHVYIYLNILVLAHLSRYRSLDWNDKGVLRCHYVPSSITYARRTAFAIIAFNRLAGINSIASTEPRSVVIWKAKKYLG